MKWLKILLTMSFFAASVFLVFKIQSMIIIKQINCHNQYGECSEQIKEMLMKQNGQNINKVKSSLSTELENDLSIKNHSFQYVFPYSLDIFVVEIKPKFAVKPANSELFYLIDKKGYIISSVDITKLPFLEVETNLMEMGKMVDESILFSGEVLYDLNYSDQVKKGLLKKDGFYVSLKNGIDVIFPINGDKEVLLGSLYAIQNQLKSDLQKSKIDSEKGCDSGCYLQGECRSHCEIDLRFQNPVIR
jgi:hypothetical protein